MSLSIGAFGSCITRGCDREATVTGHGLWCQVCDLSIQLEVEYGTGLLERFLSGESLGIPAQRDPGYFVGNIAEEPGEYPDFQFPRLPEWEDEEPYYQDDDEAML